MPARVPVTGRKDLSVGPVRALPVRGVRLKDAVDQFLSTIPSANTRRGYAIALNQLVRDFGGDSDVGLLEAERVGGWFTFKWGGRSAQTFNVRLASLRGACEYWRKQQWLVGDPLVRLVPRKAADGSFAGDDPRRGHLIADEGCAAAGEGAVDDAV